MNINFKAEKLFEKNPDRQPINIKNTGEFPCKLILNQLADRNGNSVEINLPPGGTTDFDGSYKGEIWARTLTQEAESELEIE